MTESLDSARPRALKNELAYSALRERLVLLDIAPGSPLHEGELMDELDVGRTPLREALKHLEQDHLVVTYPRRGTFATAVDITSLSEVSEVRMLMEPYAARRAAERHTEEDRARFAELLHALEGADDSTPTRDLLKADLLMHRAIYAAAHNELLYPTLSRFGALATRIWSVAVEHLSLVDSHINDHVHILEAIMGRDPERSEDLMRRHMQDFESKLRDVL